MRSLLFVPGHDARKLAKGLESGADALIVDLEDSVPEADKARARAESAAFVEAHRATRPIFVRINALASGMALDDLAAVTRAAPFGIVLPKCSGGQDVAVVDAYLSALEVREEIMRGSTRILPIATESAAAVLDMQSYARKAGPRLFGLMWGGEDLSLDVGASANRADGRYTPPFELARSLCLFGAAAAGVLAIDAVFVDFRDLDGLGAEAAAGMAAGFGAKAAIHPAQVPVINEAFTPTDHAVTEASAVVAAFRDQPDAWALEVHGRLVDRLHARAAERTLGRARPARSNS